MTIIKKYINKKQLPLTIVISLDNHKEIGLSATSWGQEEEYFSL